MTWTEAVAAMREGKRVKRDEWLMFESDIELFARGNMIMCHERDGEDVTDYNYKANIKDMIADDWTVCE